MHSLLQRQIRRHLAGVDVTLEPWLRFLEVVNRSYHDADDDRAMIESATEISSQELLQANATLRGLIQAFPDVVLLLDDAGVITSQHGGTARGFGRAHGALVGQPLRDLLTGEAVAAFDAALQLTRSSGESTTITQVSRVDGALYAHEVRLTSLDGGVVLAIVRDVTDARRNEEMRRAKEGAEAASRAKSAFLATMSHELRTPLNAILGYSEMLAEDADAGQRRDLARIEDAGRHLLTIVDAMLDIAHIEAGHANLVEDEVGMEEFVDQISSKARRAAEKKGLELFAAVQPDVPAITTDRDKLRKILTNLLDNAVKFTERGRIDLLVRQERRGDTAGVVLAVRDSGIGLPAEHLSRVFLDFAQVDESHTRKFGGAGLGLAICRRLCALLGGQVDAQSILGVGSTFSVWIPLTPHGVETATPPTPSRSTADRVRAIPRRSR